MFKKAGKRWTKKVWTGVVSAVLGLFVAVGGAVAGITLANKDKVGGNLADSSASSATGSAPVFTFYKGGKSPDGKTTYASNADAWSAAVAYSQDHGSINEVTYSEINNGVQLETPVTYNQFLGAKVQFRLVEDWTAEVFTGTHQAKYIDGSNGSNIEGYIYTGRVATNTTFFDINHRKAFGNVTFNASDESTNYVPRTGFSAYGSLCVDNGANIVLDLNGHTLNRNLFNTNGKLDSQLPYESWKNIVNGDASASGLMNAFNAKWRGEVIYVHGLWKGGTADLKYMDGTDYHSTLEVIDSAVATSDLEVTGNTIKNKKGGTVGKIMGGSTHSDAVCQESGGINSTYYTTLRINGGVICNNYSWRRGGGVAVTSSYGGSPNYTTTYYYGQCFITDGIIAQNFTDAVGGAIYLNGAILREFSGGKMLYNYSNNVAGAIYLAVGGGVVITLDVKRDASGNPLNANDEGPEVSHNTAYGSGGGIIVREHDGIILGRCRIISNRAVAGAGAGVYIETATSTAKFFDSPVIKDNKGVVDGKADSASNVYFSQAENYVEVIGKLNPVYDEDGEIEPSIGVYMSTASITGEKQGIFTKDFVTYNGSNDSAANYFTCDNLAYEVSAKVNTEGQLVVAGDFANAWNRATKQAVKSGITVNIGLNGDFSASGGLFGTGYGFGFSSRDASGFMHVPAGAGINLDMAGHIINRGINSGTARADGYIIRVDGTLTLSNTNSTQAGSMLGGNNTGNGGGIYVAKGGVLTLVANMEVGDSNAGGFGGGIYLEAGATLNLKGGTIINNNAGQDGGGIYAATGATINISGAPIVRNNTSQVSFTDNIHLQKGMLLTRGGAMASGAEVGISLGDGTGQFINSRDGISADYFRADSDIFYTVGETTQGGVTGIGLIVNSDTMSQRWTKAVQRSADNNGAPVRFDIIDNWNTSSTGSFGSGTGFKNGAIYVPSNANIIVTLIQNHTINRQLTSAVADGSVFIIDGNFLLRGTGTVCGGNTTGNGGAILANDGATVAVRGGTITCNHADGNGGAIYQSANATAVLADVTINANTAANGGGVYSLNNLSVGNNVKINSNTDTENKASNLYVGTSLTMRGTVSGTKLSVCNDSAKALTSGADFESYNAVKEVFSVDKDNVVLSITASGEAYIGIKTAEPEAAFETIVYDKKAHEAVKNKGDISALIDTAYTVSVKKFKLAADLADGETDNGVAVSLDDPLLLTNAGRYVIRFTLKDGYLWASEANRGENYIEIEVVINKATVTINTPPTISGDVYIGQLIADLQEEQLVAGSVSCASTGESEVAGVWTLSAHTEGSQIIESGDAVVNYTFTPTDESIEKRTGTIAITPAQLIVTLTEIGTDKSQESKTINVDFGTGITCKIETVTHGSQPQSQNFKIKYTLNGVEQTETIFEGPQGFGMIVGSQLNVSGVPTGVVNYDNIVAETNAKIYVGYTAQQVPYTVYHVRQLLSGVYGTHEQIVASAVDVADETAEGVTVVKVAGSGLANSNVNVQATAIRRSYDGFTYDGKLTSSENGGNQVAVAGDGSTNIFIYYSRNTYRLTFYARTADEHVTQSKEFLYEQEVDVEGIENPSKAKSNFVGWYVSEACYDGDEFALAEEGSEGTQLAGDYIGYKMPAGHKTVFAKFEEVDSKINFLMNIVGESGYGSSTAAGMEEHALNISYLHRLSSSENFSWAKSAELFDGALSGKLENHNNGTYTLSYNSATLTTTKYFRGYEPEALGYVFSGWRENIGSAESPRWVTVSNISMSQAGDEARTLVAYWTPATYEIRFDTMEAQGQITPVTARNTAQWEGADGILPQTNQVPVKLGYEFIGWATTHEGALRPILENGLPDCEWVGTQYENLGNGETQEQRGLGGENFYIYDFIKTYPEAYDRTTNTVTLYAIWNSEDIAIRVDTNLGTTKYGTITFYNGVNNVNTVKVGDRIRVAAQPNAGYELNRISVNGTYNKTGVFEFTVEARHSGGITVNAQFAAIRYSIQYNVDGGKSTDTNIVRSYDVESGTIKLPSKLTKDGYDFRGWQYEEPEAIEGDEAFNSSGLPEEGTLYGETLVFVRPERLDNVKLKAVWEAQAAPVYLYNASYPITAGYDPVQDSDGKVQYYIVREYESDTVRTGETIEIVNPTRIGYDFMGWSTRSNGQAVYLAGETTTSYKVNADRDSSNRPLNANILYAVWHVSGVQRINMSVTGNNGTYGNAITMNASPETQYGDTVTLQYKWILVFTGRYEDCFTEKLYEETVSGVKYSYFIDDNGDVVGKYLTVDPNKELVPDDRFPDGGRKTDKSLMYKELNMGAIAAKDVAVTAAHAGQIVDTHLMPASSTGENVDTYSINTVDESGLYICYLEVTGNAGTTAAGYGEAEVIMQKATYTNVELNNKTVEYNANAQGLKVTLATAPEGTATEGISEAGDIVTLPDGSRVKVTYAYSKGGVDFDAKDVTDVGTYTVTATFTWISSEGNYEDLARKEAELVITKRKITNVSFLMNHDGKESGDFTVKYDGKAYEVSGQINDKFGIATDDPTFEEVDGIGLTLKVYKVEGVVSTEVTGAITNAGSYYAMVSGITGSGKEANYELDLDAASGRKDFVISKAKRDTSKITFDSITDGVFNNELYKVELDYPDKPDEVTFSYKKTYVAENPDFTEEHYGKTDAPANGGYYAGEYTITAQFTDSNANYEKIADMTATIKIAKEKFFEFYDRDEMLTNKGFKTETFGYITNANYVPHVGGTGGLLVGGIKLTYDYYVYSEDGKTRTPYLTLTQAESVASGTKGISASGRYAIVVNIAYDETTAYGMRLSNNLELPEEEERTIYYEIAEGTVSGITVAFTSDSVKNVKLGEAFDIEGIDYITVDYGEGGTIDITNIENVVVAYGNKGGVPQNAFWHVGTHSVTFTFYGANESVDFTVTESVKKVDVEYSDDGGATWQSAANAELNKDGNYEFRVGYACTDSDGNAVVRQYSDVEKPELKHGENELSVKVAANSLYTFDDIKITVNVYTTIEDANVSWQYSADDGKNWNNLTGTELPYIGKEYKFRVAFTGVDGKVTNSDATAGDGVEALNAGGYRLTVLTQNCYIVGAAYEVEIMQIAVDFTWSTREFYFNGSEQTPVASSENILAGDRDKLEISYKYYTEEGAEITSANVIRAGKYITEVVLSSSDATLRANYTLEDAEYARIEFEIKKADIAMTVTYEEGNYGVDTTYANNPHGLRTSALKGAFEGTEVDGTFAFIKNVRTNEDGDVEFDFYESEAAISADLKQGHVEINYVYTPRNSFDYNAKYGTVNLNVKEQKSKKGNNSLTVELGAGAYSYYLVNQKFSTVGIEVYREYESFYTEGLGANRKTYGKRDRLNENINFSLEGKNGQADGKTITATDLAGGKVTLIATYTDGSNGRREFNVMESTPETLIVPDNFNKVFYVGQEFDYSKADADGNETILFTVTFESGDPITVSKGDVRSSADGHVFTAAEVGPVEVTFSAFNGAIQQTVTVEVKPKEDLALVYDEEQTMVYTEGEPLEVPVIKYNVDGEELDSLDGVSYSYTIRKDGVTVNEITGPGTYVITYAFGTVTNPRFNKPASDITITVKVVAEKYTYEFTRNQTDTEFVYNGEIIAASNVEGTVVVRDIVNTDIIIEPSKIKVEYLLNGEVYKVFERGVQTVFDREKWNVRDVTANGYNIEVRVYVDDGDGFKLVTPVNESAANNKFTIRVTLAENGFVTEPTAKNVVVGKDTDLESAITYETKFGGKVEFEYRKSGETSFIRGLPEISDRNVGKYEIKITTESTTNYKRAEKIVELEIRSGSIKNEVEGGGSVEIIDGSNGIGSGVKLDVKKVTEEDLTGIKVRKQNVLDGYDVNLVAGDVTVQPNGDVTVKVKLGSEFDGRTDLNVYLYGEDGKATKLEAEVDEDGYVVFTTRQLGRILITESVVTAPAGLIAGVSIGAIVAAALIVACVLVFLKKRSK